MLLLTRATKLSRIYMEKPFRNIVKEANDIDTKWEKKASHTRQLDQKYWHAKLKRVCKKHTHQHTSTILQQATFWIASEVKAK